MMREYHVRIYEGLGVKFPGPLGMAETLHSIPLGGKPGGAGRRPVISSAPEKYRILRFSTSQVPHFNINVERRGRPSVSIA